MAFVSDINGTDEVWVTPYPSGTPERVSFGSGRFPVWAHDGSELYYLSDDAMMRVAFNAEGFAEDVLFTLSGRFSVGGQAPPYDVASDGRFVMIEVDPTVVHPAPHVNVVLNWFEELKQRVPAGGR